MPAIAAEREFTSSVTLRQALAYMINYDTLPQEFLNGYGERVYGYYGLGQWMPQERLQQLEQMQDYTLDLERAEELLIRDGWTYDETGGAYAAGAGKLAVGGAQTVGEGVTDGAQAVGEGLGKAADTVTGLFKRDEKPESEKP